jgi:hypothetical protein
MKKSIYSSFLVSIFSIFFCYSCSNNTNGTRLKIENASVYTIPLAGNAFSSKPFAEKQIITENGIENWTDSGEYVTVYFRVSKPGLIDLSIPSDALKTEGNATLEFTVNGVSKKTDFTDSNKKEYFIGNWDIKEAGYVAVIIKGTSKEKKVFPSISALKVQSNTDDKIVFVPNNQNNFYHWGRRGPSVHLNYEIPDDKNCEWFYNEITVPADQDVIGSYYMATGFSEGYFGIQVNSATERRILFSVWSPFVTDNPSRIPESKKIKLLKKGEGVVTGQFGGEGSGGQSYFKFNWKANTTYKFLLKGVPQNDNSTIYTAYFFAPEVNEWKLMASFRRPETNTYLEGFHSFLENFEPEQGFIPREVLFDNQWVCDEKGNWIEINSAKFTTDETGNRGYRMDYSGGLVRQSFFLKNCGFFSNYTKSQTIFTRPLKQKKPNINFTKLP